MSRDLILAALKPKAVSVDLSAFGVSGVGVRMMSLTERDAYMAQNKDITGNQQLARIVQFMAITEPDGKRLFGDGDEAFAEVMSLGSKAVDALAAAALKANGLSKGAAEAAEKN